MKFEEILPYLRSGEKITRQKWLDESDIDKYLNLKDSYLNLKDTLVMELAGDTKRQWSATHVTLGASDLLADDWILYRGGEE